MSQSLEVAAPLAMSQTGVGAARGHSDVAFLTAGLVQGNEQAYRQFHELYFDRLLRYLLVVTRGDEQAAREALQATFLRVVRYVKVFSEEGTFWSWLTVLARSALLDEQRRESRYRSLLRRFFPPEPAALPQTEPETPVLLLELVEANLSGLDSVDRDLVERKYLSRQSVREIAAALSTTEKSVESRLVRARRRPKELVLAQLKHEKAP